MPRKKGCLSSRNKQYWLNKGYDDDTSITMARSRMPGTVEYFEIYKGFDKEESIKLSKEWGKNNSTTLENCVRKFGLEVGTEKFKSYCEKQAKSNTFEYKRDKFGWTKEQFDEYNLSRSVTLDNLIKRHGVEEGTIKFESYRERQRYAGCQLEYFIEKYGSVEGTEKYNQINFLKSHSFDSFLFRCDGDVETATELYLKSKERVVVPYSEIANELFEKLFSELSSRNFNKIFYSNNIGEWYVYDNNKKRIFFLDFFVKELGRGIEFNGDYWHANPIKYSTWETIKFPNNTIKTPQEIWKDDEYKLSILKKHPDIKDVMVVWENDYRTNKQLIIEQCLNFLLQ